MSVQDRACCVIEGGTLMADVVLDDPIDLTEGWKLRGACRSASPELFFPAGTTGMAAADIDAAKAICAGCAVRRECLGWAVATNQEFGIWGGTTEEERRGLRRHWVRRPAARRNDQPHRSGGRRPAGAIAQPGEVAR